MKYYDGFGKDVSDYVASLEQRIQQLQVELDKLAPKMESEVADSSPPYYPEEEKSVETEKSKRKRSKKKVDANPT